MDIRSSRISQSISGAVTTPPRPAPPSLVAYILERVVSFFAIFHLCLVKYRAADFASLRRSAWRMSEEEYLAAFAPPNAAPHPAATKPSTASHVVAGKAASLELMPVGDLGYSGSTFFATPDAKFLIKSLPRRFEHTFFTHDLFGPYLEHMHARPESLLVRITDMLYTRQPALGGILGTAPTHHIIMENLLYGKKEWEQAMAGSNEDRKTEKGRWETYDLKPDDYFYPERDVAGGKLTPETVKDRLVDVFPSKIRVSSSDKSRLLALLSADTALLAEHNAVDYSLFCVRYPGPDHARASSAGHATASDVTPVHGQDCVPVPFIECEAHPWRRGLVDADRRWAYRVVILDFFWARHKFRAQAMAGLIGAVDMVAGTGPMSITAEPGEYRGRFLRMVDKLVEGV